MFRTSLLVVLLGLVAMAAAGAVVEYQHASSDCSDMGTIAQQWKVDTCIGVGNQPPYASSETVEVEGNTAVFRYFTGGTCNGTHYQTSNQTLDVCHYFAGTIYTVFKAE